MYVRSNFEGKNNMFEFDSQKTNMFEIFQYNKQCLLNMDVRVCSMSKSAILITRKAKAASGRLSFE